MEGVTLLHEAFDAAADLLQTGLVLADAGDVLLDRRAVGVAVIAGALSQADDEAEDLGLHLLPESVQALVGVVHEGLGGDRGRQRFVTEEPRTA